MRNVFDHYHQAENQLTHALFSALQQDPVLLRKFLAEICHVTSPCKIGDLGLSVQKYPFDQRYSETEVEARNLPDAWIFSEDGWALVFEAKITASLTKKQLDGHQRVAVKRGFEDLRFFTIVGDPCTKQFDGWTQLTWQEIYIFLRSSSKQQMGTTWAAIAADYFEILEAKMLEEGKLGSSEITEFTGMFGAEDDYSYMIAKSKLKQAMRGLRADTRLIEQLGMDPNAKGRSAITGKSEDRVWDYLSLTNPYNTSGFTKFVHLTVGIKFASAEAMVTFPNGLATKPKNAIKALGLDGFKQVTAQVLRQMQIVMEIEPSAVPVMSALQRRYPTQRSVPFLDAKLKFDLRTAFEGDGPKLQKQWIEALFDAFCHKKSNYQFQIGIEFYYAQCPSMHDANALDLLAKSCLACKPFIDVARG